MLIEETESNYPFSIDIHVLISYAHNAHGLRHNDFAQYRSYCSRRLARLRHHKPVRRDLSFSASGYKSSTSDRLPIRGGRHAFHPRGPFDDTLLLSHENFALVALYETERAWAHAMELKDVYDHLKSQTGAGKKKTPVVLGGMTRSSPGSVRCHYLKRFKKACKNVEQLERHVEIACDEKTRAEAKTYSSWIKGNYYFEIGNWELACKELGFALILCQALGHGDITLENGDIDLELRDIFTSRANNVIQPLLRFSQFELRQAQNLSSKDLHEYMKSFQEELLHFVQDSSNKFLKNRINTILDTTKDNALSIDSSDSGSEMNKIVFRGQKVNVDNKNVRMILIKLLDRKQDLSESERGASDEDSTYVDILSLFDDAITLISDDMKGYMNMASGPSVNAKKLECQSLLGYIKYERLRLLMSRTESMIEDVRTNKQHNNSECKRFEEIAHLYDTLLQDASAVVGLPGGVVSETASWGTQIEDEFVLQAKANVIRIRALRCYYIGRLYGSETLRKYAEALALYEQALKLAAQAAEEIAACQDMENSKRLIQSLLDLQIEVTKATCVTKADAILACKGGSSVHSRSLLRRLDDFDSGGVTFHVSDVPPLLEPVSCKPSFFDVAGKYVCDYPSEELQKHLMHYKPQLSRGILGWFRSS